MIRTPRYPFGKTSRSRLMVAHPLLIALFWRVTDYQECSVLCSIRSKADQDAAYADGKSSVQWPNSKHNVTPERPRPEAVDVAPWFPGGIPWGDHKAFIAFGGIVKAVAMDMGIPIRWGGDWDADGRMDDQTFNDYPHFELDWSLLHDDVIENAVRYSERIG